MTAYLTSVPPEPHDPAAPEYSIFRGPLEFHVWVAPHDDWDFCGYAKLLRERGEDIGRFDYGDRPSTDWLPCGSHLGQNLWWAPPGPAGFSPSDIRDLSCRLDRLIQGRDVLSAVYVSAFVEGLDLDAAATVPWVEVRAITDSVRQDAALSAAMTALPALAKHAIAAYGHIFRESVLDAFRWYWQPEAEAEAESPEAESPGSRYDVPDDDFVNILLGGSRR